MQATVQQSLLTRDDTMFGVCQGLGEDFGFNPIYLRVTFAVLLMWNPLVVLGAYAGAGVAVMASRWLAPDPRSAFAEAMADEPVLPQADNNAEAQVLAVAA